jgi:transcriptional repressor NrdR|uniref:Transcriptional repressor NrdR n=1 Tax=candidate division WOR-3 bacterium TaxID=2052148 RepID=A0A7C6A920_UNCW3
MKCPNCGKEDDRVLDTRVSQGGEAVRRRRECLACGYRFTTYEYIERTPVTVIKRDGGSEPFDRNKLITGITLACAKRPITKTQIEKIVNDIEIALADEYKSEVSSKELGEMVLDRLAKIDQVAYVRFASVYRAYQNVEQFIAEIPKLLKGTDKREQ